MTNERKVVNGKILYSLRGRFNELCSDIEWFENEIQSLMRMRDCLDPETTTTIRQGDKEFEVTPTNLHVLCDEKISSLRKSIDARLEDLESLVEFKRHRFED